MGLRYELKRGDDGGPFRCDRCNNEDKKGRNCFNRLELSEHSRAVENYKDDINREIKKKKASKVFSLGRIRLYECPLSYIAPETYELIRLVYLINESGVLLHEGGWGNQPYWLIEAYEIYKVETAQHLKSLRDNGRTRDKNNHIGRR